MNWLNKLRTTWRVHIKPVWQEFHWSLIGVLWLITLGLGIIGFRSYFAAHAEPRASGDVFYLALQLFALESGSIPGPMGWELETARFMAPAVATYTALMALLVIFHDQIRLFLVRFIRNHVVICGLGQKGLLLTRGFLERGDRVVVIESDEGNDMIEPCKEQGAIVLVGTATDRLLLRKARVPEARYLLSVCGDDGVNAEVAVHARDLVGNRRGKVLTCLIHIVDPLLCSLLREQEIESEKVDAYRMEFFNVYDSGARALLNEFPAFDPVGRPGDSPPHLLMVGWGQMGESLVVHAARSWRSRNSGTDGRLSITLIDPQAGRKKDLLVLRYPQMEKTCDLVPLQVDMDSPVFQGADFLFDGTGRCMVTSVYICLDNAPAGVSAALVLVQKLRHHKVPIVVCMAQDAGLAKLLNSVDTGGFHALHAFGLLDRTCRPEMVLGGTHEVLARSMHEDYVRNQAKKGLTPQSNPSMVPWDKLPENLKESNRRQSDYIGVKLKAVGCGIAPLTDWDAELFRFTPGEIELLARMEHERWVQERRQDGWTYQPGPKNLEKKTSPFLVPWDQLPDDTKENDRNMVRGLPGFLARADLQIYRLELAN